MAGASSSGQAQVEGGGAGGPPNRGRRDLFRIVFYTGILGTFGALLYPVVRFLRPRPGTAGGPMQVKAPFRANELRADPEGHWPEPFNFGGKPCLVIKTPEGDVRAFNAICTHMDCTVEFRPGEKDIFCNCHNGVYDLMGRPVSGPPPRPLEKYRVKLEGDSGQEQILVSR